MQYLKKINKLVIASAILGGVSFNSVSASAKELQPSKEPEATITVVSAETGKVLSQTKTTARNVNPLDSWDYNRTHDKTVQSMYGQIYMKVSYDRNLTTSTSKITGILSLTNTDSYLKLIDKWYNSSTAQAQYYDSTHKVNVYITIKNTECK